MLLIRKYFPDLDPEQSRRFEQLLKIIPLLNEKVNVISRKDVDHLEERHILHSLSIAKKFNFNHKTTVFDVGTGGGFPGIPLAILFPETHFTLVDSIGKKIRLVKEVAEQLNLKNVYAIQERMENLDNSAHYVISRAVTSFPQLVNWSNKLIKDEPTGKIPNGLISLKGGDLKQELKSFDKKVELIPISNWFDEAFFYAKMIVFLKK